MLMGDLAIAYTWYWLLTAGASAKSLYYWCIGLVVACVYSVLVWPDHPGTMIEYFACGLVYCHWFLGALHIKRFFHGP